ncbi:MAG: nucleotidyltransferase domain-containing protein [Chloroflexota bacterium]|nr:nucleotidyltransferase domain-containing protein [Chloroflexota bacterium]
MSAGPHPADAAVVQAFIATLRASGFTVATLVWYGSRARGTATHPQSDFDLIVVAPEFAAYGWVERLVAAYACWSLAYAADILCYTPDEFARLAGRASIVREALQTGRRVDVGQLVVSSQQSTE